MFFIKSVGREIILFDFLSKKREKEFSSLFQRNRNDDLVTISLWNSKWKIRRRCSCSFSCRIESLLIRLLFLVNMKIFVSKGYRWLKEKILSEEGRKQQNKLRELTALSSSLNCTLTQLAIGWFPLKIRLIKILSNCLSFFSQLGV